MASRRFRPLTAENLSALPELCARCTFWEASLHRPRHVGRPSHRPQAKLDWAESVTEHWGYCGVIAVNDGETIGYLTMAPSMYVLGSARSPPTGEPGCSQCSKASGSQRSPRQGHRAPTGAVGRRNAGQTRHPEPSKQSGPIGLRRRAWCRQPGSRPSGSWSCGRTRSRHGFG